MTENRVSIATIEQQPSQKFGKHEGVRITKNVVVIGLAFMIHFTGFYGTTNLQSSVNSDGALGTATLAVMYGCLILSNIFLPGAVIRWLGCKWTMAISFILYIPYIAAQYYPRFYTLVPAALGVGFGGAPLWCSKCTYLSIAAEAMARFSGGDAKAEVIVVKFFGLFFVFYQISQVWGNLISSSILSSELLSSHDLSVKPLPQTIVNETIRNVGKMCGFHFCPGVDAHDNPNLAPPEPRKIHILTTIFIICMVIASLLIVFGVDSLKRYGWKKKGSSSEPSGKKLLAITVKLLTERYQLLLLPITMFIGAEEAFIAVDFTAAFVACGWGISNIGYAMICFGVANAIAAGVAGALAKLVGRSPIIAICFVLHGGLLIWMHEWTPVQGDYMSYFSMAALWGVADGFWLVNINAFSGILFPGKEIAAYSNFRLWESTGSVITYAVSPFLCTSTKLRTLMALMTVGVCGYGAIEYMERKAKGIVELKNVELVARFDKHEHEDDKTVH